MKKQITLYFMLVTPLALWAQASATTTAEIDLSDVVVIDDSVDGGGAISGGSTVSMPTVVEIPEAAVEGASLDIAEPVIPVVEQMPLGTEVVLEIPGQIGSGATSLMDSAETISVDFPDEDVRTILRNVADLFDLNLVIPDTLQGRTSLKLSNITWRQVFEVVLEPQGFTYIEDRNIIRIKSLEELTAEPVDTQVFIVDYARAEDLRGSISPLVDEAAGGRIQVDVRSNALVITERPSRMNKIQDIIQRLDKATDQVMIESKFIEVTNSDVKNIGVNWASMSGYSASAGPFQRDWARGRGNDATSDTSDSFTDTFPGTSSESMTFDETLSRLASTSRTDTALFSADQFEVILSALEAQDDVRLVSNPTVVTLNNTNAKISIGERYPIPNYSFNSQTGERQLDDISYEDIGINLDVTPQVNSAGFINLEITPEVSSSDRFALVENTEIPIIESRRTETTIMIKDGFTLAIGGLVENSTSNRDTKIPVLGNLPGVGRLFSSNTDSIEQRNLIIFITAKTLNPDGSTYKDVIDPRVIDQMGIVPSELPGYQLDSDETAALETLESFRINDKVVEQHEERSARINAYELAERQKLLAEERAKMQAEKEQTTRRSRSRINR
ncbi:MAG: type II secretion system protein GspD [Opitutaceae bacterium]